MIRTQENIKLYRPGLTIIVTGLLTALTSLYSSSYAGQSRALIEAAGSWDIKQVQNLLDECADVNTQDRYGITALMSAAEIGDLATVKLLLEKGADINVKDSVRGQAALMHAVSMRRHPAIVVLPWKGHLAIVKLLLAKGADVNAKDDKGWTALMWASHEGDLTMLKLLVKKGADVNARDNEGRTALTMASQTNYLNKGQVMKLLKTHGVKLN